MNFTTDLPKRNPLVSYIVASAVRCEKFFPPDNKKSSVYRMHAVILKSRPSTSLPQYALYKHRVSDDDPNAKDLFICCHVRRVENGDEDESDDNA